jgi:thiamine-phosphate pyrophosphorylase
VTDRRRAGASALLDLIASAARAGVDLIQVREPGISDRALLDLVRAALIAVEGTRARVIVNERTDVALAAGAAGVHLKAASVPASRVRAIAPHPFLIGRSVHTLDEAVAADRDGVDYLCFGTVFPSQSKPPGHRVAGLDALRTVTARVSVPVLAIGGVTERGIQDVAAEGAGGVAAIGLFAATPDLPALVRTLRRAFDSGSEVN